MHALPAIFGYLRALHVGHFWHNFSSLTSPQVLINPRHVGGHGLGSVTANLFVVAQQAFYRDNCCILDSNDHRPTCKQLKKRLAQSMDQTRMIKLITRRIELQLEVRETFRKQQVEQDDLRPETSLRQRSQHHTAKDSRLLCCDPSPHWSMYVSCTTNTLFSNVSPSYFLTAIYWRGPCHASSGLTQILSRTCLYITPLVSIDLYYHVTSRGFALQCSSNYSKILKLMSTGINESASCQRIITITKNCGYFEQEMS